MLQEEQILWGKVERKTQQGKNEILCGHKSGSHSNTCEDMWNLFYLWPAITVELNTNCLQQRDCSHRVWPHLGESPHSASLHTFKKTMELLIGDADDSSDRMLWCKDNMQDKDRSRPGSFSECESLLWFVLAPVANQPRWPHRTVRQS